jgi:pseudouridine-5'-phosphate glycosidase
MKYNKGFFFFLHFLSSLQETQGVCVAAYKTNEFPAFFTETSGCKVLMVSEKCFLELHCSSIQ